MTGKKDRWIPVGKIWPDTENPLIEGSGNIDLGVLGQVPVILRKSKFDPGAGYMTILARASALPLSALREERRAKDKQEDIPF
jgi:hypothetical protein